MKKSQKVKEAIVRECLVQRVKEASFEIVKAKETEETKEVSKTDNQETKTTEITLSTITP